MIIKITRVSFVLTLVIILSIQKISLAQIIPYDSYLIVEDYGKMVEERRATEEASFRKKETTLLSDAYFKNFAGLNYFPIDLKYRAVGKLTRLPESVTMNLDLTDGTPYGFMHYGKVNFFLEGAPIELIVFEFPSRSGPPALFIPFTDKTTGKENFGGGRFLIVTIPKGEQIFVDFNMAINPICVYDPEHACPISPKSNFIPKRITAGAKMYYDSEEADANR